MTKENESGHSDDLLKVEHAEDPLQSLLNVATQKTNSAREPSVKPAIVKPQPSSVLSRVRAFLPQLEQANAVMEQRLASDPGSLDIEKLDEDEDYIEMDLAMVPRDESDSDSEETDDDDDVPCIGEVSEDNLRLPGGRVTNKPVIVDVSSDTDHGTSEEQS